MMRVPILAGLPLALVPTWAWAQGPSGTTPYGYDHYGPHMMWWGGGGWYGMIFGPLIMILLLALVIAAVVLLIRWAGGQLPGGAPHQGRSPLDILKERYARGEIDKEEYTAPPGRPAGLADCRFDWSATCVFSQNKRSSQ